MIRRGIVFLGGHSVEEMAELAVQAEASGVDSIWVAEGPLGRDAFVGLTAIAARTKTVQLGTGVVNPFTRHPAQLAASFATLDEASHGRAICGVGVGTLDHLEKLGFDVSRPLAAMREAIVILRRLIARETLTYVGKKFQTDGIRIGFRPARGQIPLYVGATGPRLCALTGELADGIYMPYGTSKFLRRGIDAALAGRGSDKALDVASQIPMCAAYDHDLARNRVKPGIGMVLTAPNAEAVLEANGLDPGKAQRVRDRFRAEGVRGLISMVDDEIVDTLAVTGTPEECQAKLQEVVDAGVNHPTVSVLGELDLTLRALRSVEHEPHRSCHQKKGHQ